MKRNFLLAILFFLVTTVAFTGCGQTSSDMKDGYYSAEAADFDDDGWKEFITIYVSDGKVITVEYDAFNAGGFVKSWDISYMRAMKIEAGTYPSEYARAYAISLINWQNPDDVEVVAGAADYHTSFQMLARAAIANSKAGDKRVTLVDIK